MVLLLLFFEFRVELIADVVIKTGEHFKKELILLIPVSLHCSPRLFSLCNPSLLSPEVCNLAQFSISVAVTVQAVSYFNSARDRSPPRSTRRKLMDQLCLRKDTLCL